MPAKQGNNRNRRITRICTMGLLTALCMIFGYIETFIPLTAIAPGVKIGLSNAVALILIMCDDIKGAFFVNITRILLSALLFGSLFSLLFSAVAGVGSLIVSSLLYKTRVFSVVGISVAGAVTHNILQLAVALFIVGQGAVYYTPILLIGGAISGVLVGIPSKIIIERLK